MSILGLIDRWPRPVLLATGGAMLLVLALLDLATGTGLSFSIFYLLPVAMLAWFGGRVPGLTAAVVSAGAWAVIEFPTSEGLTGPMAWNIGTRLVMFILVSLLLTRLREGMARETSLARTDYLTGAANARAFHEIAEAELERMRRYNRPFTIAYMDVDDFKQINDRLGHSVGNDLLRTVVDTVRESCRATDTVARLGGDEFAILLPETAHLAARDVLGKIHGRLMSEMQRCEWPVSFSIGVLTCLDPPRSVNSMVRFADELMYSIKLRGKNGIRYQNLVAHLATEPVADGTPIDPQRRQAL